MQCNTEANPTITETGAIFTTREDDSIDNTIEDIFVRGVLTTTWHAIKQTCSSSAAALIHRGCDFELPTAPPSGNAFRDANPVKPIKTSDTKSHSNSRTTA
jgi:hypothetical protein